MFCSACGTQLQPGLVFCSRCGKRATDYGGETVRTPLSVAGNVAGVGFVAFIFVLLVLVMNGVFGNDLIPITFFYFAALFGVCFMFLRHGKQVNEVKNHSSSVEPQYLKPVTTAQLPEPADSPASVTENTTRTLQDVLRRNR